MGPVTVHRHSRRNEGSSLRRHTRSRRGPRRQRDPQVGCSAADASSAVSTPIALRPPARRCAHTQYTNPAGFKARAAGRCPYYKTMSRAGTRCDAQPPTPTQAPPNTPHPASQTGHRAEVLTTQPHTSRRLKYTHQDGSNTQVKSRYDATCETPCQSIQRLAGNVHGGVHAGCTAYQRAAQESLWSGLITPCQPRPGPCRNTHYTHRGHTQTSLHQNTCPSQAPQGPLEGERSHSHPHPQPPQQAHTQDISTDHKCGRSACRGPPCHARAVRHKPPQR